MNRKTRAILGALLAAFLYALNIPASKALLTQVGPVMMASLLYLGAGVGMTALSAVNKGAREASLTRQELPYVIGMIVLDMAAPICLMLGLKTVSPAHAALLNNFEIVATALIALLLFKERVSGVMWGAIGLITLACVLLSWDGAHSLRFSGGSLLVLAACACWGLENNCTRVLSKKSAAQIVILKGIFSGLGSLVVALLVGESLPPLSSALPALLLGFVSYGLSIFFYVRAQRDLGAARTSAYYSVNPFIASILSLVLFSEPLAKTYFPALAVMAAGALLTVRDTLRSQ